MSTLVVFLDMLLVPVRLCPRTMLTICCNDRARQPSNSSIPVPTNNRYQPSSCMLLSKDLSILILSFVSSGPAHPPVQAPGVPYKGQAVTLASGARHTHLVSEVQPTPLMETNLAPVPRLEMQWPQLVVAKSSEAAFTVWIPFVTSLSNLCQSKSE